MYKDIQIKPPKSTELSYARRKKLSARQIVELAIAMSSDDESFRYEENLK